MQHENLASGFNREKCEVKLVGTPLTHQRFLRRPKGTDGPAIQAGKDSFLGHGKPVNIFTTAGTGLSLGLECIPL